MEFTEYRQYSPGDDLRHLDWKVLARTDREFIRKYEEETNLRCLFLVDTSRSMLFGSHGWTKADYARTLAATFALFLHQQRDVVGLALFADGIADYVPPRWRPGHFRRIVAALEREPSGRDTNLAHALGQAALLARKRSLIFILSDFLSPVAEWEAALGHLTAAHHDVRVVQVLDPAEQSLEFGSAAVWEDMETGLKLYVDPQQARAAYREKFSAHAAAVRAAFDARGVAHQVVTTNQPLDFALLELIQPRGAARRFGQRRIQL